jgi:glycosyltransferase involved in cell wall biosynthesis
MSELAVFVMLPRHLDVAAWRERFSSGGVPDKTPYGYHFAEDAGAIVTFSQPTVTPTGLLGLADKLVKLLCGFDIRHAWCNRNALFGNKFDVVWTHTEYEHLAIAALQPFFKMKSPPVIAQSVWLIDEWDNFWGWKRWLYRVLLRHAAIATFHSPANQSASDMCGIPAPTALVLFGISLDSFPLTSPTAKFERGRDIRVLALGSDRHRDWHTLFDAIGAKPGYELRVGSSYWPVSLKASNVEVGLMSQAQVRAAYDWADCVVVPLKRNLHASGITAILEAVALGVPVVATRTGGLEAYFDDDAVKYVEIGDPLALRTAVSALAHNIQAADDQAHTAQRQLVERDLTSRGFALRHVALSQKLLSRADRRAVVS